MYYRKVTITLFPYLQHYVGQHYLKINIPKHHNTSVYTRMRKLKTTLYDYSKINTIDFLWIRQSLFQKCTLKCTHPLRKHIFVFKQCTRVRVYTIKSCKNGKNQDLLFQKYNVLICTIVKSIFEKYVQYRTIFIKIVNLYYSLQVQVLDFLKSIQNNVNIQLLQNLRDIKYYTIFIFFITIFILYPTKQQQQYVQIMQKLLSFFYASVRPYRITTKINTNLFVQFYLHCNYNNNTDKTYLTQQLCDILLPYRAANYLVQQQLSKLCSMVFKGQFKKIQIKPIGFAQISLYLFGAILLVFILKTFVQVRKIAKNNIKQLAPIVSCLVGFEQT
eukprot:TRINITY_DN12102_c1_g2_i2.p1 TRINITY_DN12102_c1_g2~~TRINITY_DN12102_c1_g2_i2.p1  ORF type:complete len:331 (+),score=-24.60 TRINITY_DN12102_c1_g2_i2:64-1056(+)